MFTSCPREMMLCTVHTIYILQTKWRGACVHVQSELIQYNSFIKTILFFICWWIEWSTDNRIEEAISVRYFIKVEAAGWEKAERDGDEVRDLNVRMYVKRGAAQQQWRECECVCVDFTWNQEQLDTSYLTSTHITQLTTHSSKVTKVSTRIIWWKQSQDHPSILFFSI